MDIEPNTASEVDLDVGPPVTVAIPTIGRVETLPAVLYSIAMQQHAHVAELLLLDEADSPVTENFAVNQVLDLLSLMEVQVRILRNRRRAGIGNARIRLALEAKNDRLMMVDDDVLLRPYTMAALYRALEEHRAVAHWAVPSCLLVNKGLDLDGYLDERVSRDDPRVTKWTEKYPWFIPYYLYRERFTRLLPVAGTQAILIRHRKRLIDSAMGMVQLGSLPREDTYMTRKMGLGVFTSVGVCDHIEHLDQKNRLLWGSSMFYRLHEAAMARPDDFVDLLGSWSTNESDEGVVVMGRAEDEDDEPQF